jgi:hypothetical protein
MPRLMYHGAQCLGLVVKASIWRKKKVCHDSLPFSSFSTTKLKTDKDYMESTMKKDKITLSKFQIL